MIRPGRLKVPGYSPRIPMSSPRERIVAGGDERYREARDYQAVRMRVLAEVSKRFEDKKAKSSFWRRWWIEVMIRREVRAAMKREFPAGGLYLSAHVERLE